MKALLSFLLLSVALYSNVYYSKVNPYELRNISSNVSGVVLFANENMIGEHLTDNPYIKIDTELDIEELKTIEEKLSVIKSTLAINKDMLDNLENSIVKKRANYKKVQSLKIKSSVEKDREFYDLITSENSILVTQKEINTLKTQIADLKLRRAQLKRSVEDKTLIAKNYVLYELKVKVGEVVNKGTPLATLQDTRKAILTIYLDEEDVVGAKNRVVFIDGEKTSYKVSRVLNIADSKNISKYMAQIVIESPKVFSKLVKVELK